MKLYNTKNGIETYLGSLEGLHRLAKDRRSAKDRGETLDTFCVLGRWHLDMMANLSLMIDEERRGHRAPASLGKVPKVMTEDELHLFMRGENCGWSHGWALPPEYATCTECGKGWTIENCHLFVHRQDSDEGPLESFVGKPLSEVEQIPSLVGKLWHRVEHEAVYNETYKGESRSGPNGKKWHRVENGYLIQPGDRAMLQTMVFHHKECGQKRLQRISREEMTTIFARAGFPQAQLISIPNQYCPCDACPPWYTVQVDDLPTLTIGWRKRVINISWSQHGKDLSPLFSEENVTKEAHLIHAWSDAKASEYLSKILPALGAKAAPQA